jgi:dephospho-CoA kinase
VSSAFGGRNSESPPAHAEDRATEGPCVVGLTGGLASGKSTVASLLADRGIPVLDADVVVHDLYRPGGEGTAAVTRIFGAAVLDATGGVDRGVLGGRVLRDRDLRLALERAIHPLVRQQIGRWIEGLGAVPVAVVEAALLVETGSYRAYDVLMVAHCNEYQQIERALARGIPEERVRALVKAQRPLDEKRELADVVIDNSGPRHGLDDEVARAWIEVTRLCGERRAGISRDDP